jgi:hypothetical protein
MKLLVYTAVFGGYDRVFPPVMAESALDYVVVTDDPDLKPAGWRVLRVDPADYGSPKAANLHYKALMHREMPGYDASLYIDGNVRLLGRTSEVFDRFLASGAALGVFRHPTRDCVADEVEACILGRKGDPETLRAELTAYRDEGFADDQGLIEATIILKNHNAPDLDPAMALWRDLFSRFRTRDQFSLPVVKARTGVSCVYHDFNFRNPNPWFGHYPHRGAAGVRPLYADIFARAYDSGPHRLLLRAWQAWWSLRRRLGGSGGENRERAASDGI